MTKKIIVILIILLVFGLISSFLVYQFQKKEEEEKKELVSTELVPGEIITANLEKVLLPSPGSEGAPERVGVSSTFQPDDLISVQLEADIKQEAILTLQLFNGSGERVDLPLPQMKVFPESRNYGICCFIAPRLPGRYILKLFLNGKEVKTLDFEVIF